jgi:wyosine [tRNA(Phe)-imidazoG37] synthetase (radical SAM superfamily)
VSLGVNLLPAGGKVCNMNCAYCQYGWTRGAARSRGQGAGWPTLQAVESAVSERLMRAAERNEMIDRLTVAGHGEPTLHPEFDDVTARLCAVRDRIAPRLPIVILSNSTTVGRPEVRRGLERYDERYMKLDAGDPITYARINGVAAHVASIERIIDALATLPPITIQAMFVADTKGDIDNSTEGAVEDWLRALEIVQAPRIHIYTLDRPPALSSLRPVPARRLREIAGHVRLAGMIADVFAKKK